MIEFDGRTQAMTDLAGAKDPVRPYPSTVSYGLLFPFVVEETVLGGEQVVFLWEIRTRLFLRDSCLLSSPSPRGHQSSLLHSRWTGLSVSFFIFFGLDGFS